MNYCNNDKTSVVPDTTKGTYSFKYIGSFNVPNGSGGEAATFAWAGRGLAYNPANNSLYMTGHIYHHHIAEISIPTPAINNNYSELPTASILQNFVDITNGHMTEILAGGGSIPEHDVRLGGLLVYKDKLYGTAYSYYEQAANADLSHFSNSLDLSQNSNFSGMYKVGNLNPGFVSGYMALIPKDQQEAFGGATALTGNFGIPIISRSSFGPAASTFSPEYIEQSDPSNSVGLVYYPETHQTLGRWDNESTENPIFNMTSGVRGIVFPKESNTVFFIGRTGTGIPEYGAGTADASLAGTQVGNYDEYYVYDPANLAKGCHAWPYTCYIWEYNVDELLSVFKGEKEAWEITPSNHYAIDLPYGNDESEYDLGGVAYDTVNNRIYISMLRINHDKPVIHVYDLIKY